MGSDLWPEVPVTKKQPTAEEEFKDYLKNHAFIYTDQTGRHSFLDFLPGSDRVVENIVREFSTHLKRAKVSR